MGEQRSLHPAAGESSYPADPSHGSVLAPAQQSHSGRRLRILCLHGFRQSARSFEAKAAAAAGVALPSLHIFGGGGGDRQISTEESAALAGCFHPAQRTEGRHSAGHLIPSSGPVLAALREFLQQQQQRLALGQRPDQQCKLPK
ncbi:rhodanese-like domain-containing 6 isoform X1 [Chlorella sorokiniana]|uniref:Rhodanese-like domain-containing 6 isoform X1 n=1 Tax=Chlorella sorokiniana TaxID=3076 RepID=A0A2P6TLF0_CHLSO|nr:rhodanese-like domain-containing 6 isoform X1 [Chlorella sorokiniana]|eukprot:PRW45114.1 rhodanese-like domain-containing 6 isoform X1 [Chlorella sorokiniana]